MANPQPDVFVKVSTELAIALAKTNLSAYESRVVWCVLIKTYGWNKKTDRISRSQFAEMTGIKPWHIWETLQLLIDRQIIICKGEGQNLEYGIQKDYEKWGNRCRKHRKPAPICVEPAPNGESDDLASTCTPLRAGDKNANLHVSACKPAPICVEPAPPCVETCSPIGAHNRRKQLQKNNTKAVDGGDKKTFEEYREELRARFKDLDFDVEYEKFRLYWFEGKRKCKNPKLSLLNWMTKAREIKGSQIQKLSFRPDSNSKRVTGRTEQYSREDYLEGIQ